MPRRPGKKGTASDPKIIAKVCKLASQCISQAEIGRRFGHSQAWAARILQLAGVKSNNIRYERRKKVAADLEAGMEVRKACQRHRCTENYIRKVQIEFDLVRERLDIPRVCKIIADLWLRVDLSHDEIGTRYGVSKAAVQKVGKLAKAAGLPCGRKAGRPRTTG